MRKMTMASMMPVPVLELPQFDLSAIAERVARKNPEWTSVRLNDAVAKYRAFLAGAKAKPGAAHHVTDADLDEVWHTHILFTRKYGIDCMSYFGYFFHHAPTPKGELEMVLTKTCCSGGCDG